MLTDDDRYVARGLFEKLFRAVLEAEYSVDPVRTALAQGADPNYSNIDGDVYTTVLHSAVHNTQHLRQEKVDALTIDYRKMMGSHELLPKTFPAQQGCENRCWLKTREHALVLGASRYRVNRQLCEVNCFCGI